eukprot:Skav221409  [mRNA]  locus=scaffold1621:196336:200546:- [translate_table: standard]
MSGGPKHVVQALANLEILRSYKSYLPVEFWHASELEDAHCEALAASGAQCRVVPGVYRRYGTIVPAVMSSSFQHVLWMDTDITPLLAVDRFFETDAYQRHGALFWPDHWSQDCELWGESSWPNFVALKLLGLKHNASDRHFSQEHETGLFLIDKLRHWRVIYLANYLSSRHFFTQILVGCKDAFRLAFLKLNVPHWLSPVRPGLAGTLLASLFYSSAMVQFWPCGEVLGDGYACTSGRALPVFIHQKKLPGLLWTDILTFRQPMGQCTRFELAPLDVTHGDTLLWDVESTDPKLAETLFDLDLFWDKSFAGHFERLKKRSTLSEKNQQRLAFGLDPFLSRPWNQMSHVCRCDFGNNFWLYLLTYLSSNQTLEGSDKVFTVSNCKIILQEEVDVSTCPVGFATLAVLCHRSLKDWTAKQKVKQLALDLRPALKKCLPLSFWPLKLDSGGAGTLSQLDRKVVSELTEPLRKCLPLAVPACWLRWNTLIESANFLGFQQQSLRGTGSVDKAQALLNNKEEALKRIESLKVGDGAKILGRPCEKHRQGGSDTAAKEVRIRYLPQPDMDIEDDDRAVKPLGTGILGALKAEKYTDHQLWVFSGGRWLEGYPE